MLHTRIGDAGKQTPHHPVGGTGWLGPDELVAAVSNADEGIDRMITGKEKLLRRVSS